MIKIKDLPSNERPREKALTYGVESLSNSELLAIIIASGTKQKSALEIANDILASIEDIGNFSSLTFSTLTDIEGISNVKAILLLSLVELNKRINTSLRRGKEFNIKEIVSYFQSKYKGQTTESSYLVLLDKNNRLIMIRQTFSGNENSISVSQKRIIQYLIDNKASSYYLVHNHPSGNPIPSGADLTMTNNVELLALSLGFVLEDHLIFGQDSYYSIKGKIELPYLK